MNKIAPVIAAIDVGTNSFHLVIASVNNRGMLQIKTREKEVVRLGSSSRDMKYLTPDAIERGVKAMSNFVKLARSAKAEVIAVATSAVREAENRDIFLDKVFDETGVKISVVSGAEEGRLIYIGALHSLPIFSKKALIIDIGGGSTETIIGFNGEIKFVNSAKLGAIRMTKHFFPDDIITKEQIKQCRDYIRGEWAPTFRRIEAYGFDVCIGTAGTIQNIAAMSLLQNGEYIPDVLNGLTAKKKYILKTINKILDAKTVEERIEIPGLDPKRADIIVGGALILECIIEQLGIESILLSSYALREGILFDRYKKKQINEEQPQLSNLRYESILNLCNFYRINFIHAEYVKKISLLLFDELQKKHKLGFEEREWLEAASMLHDVGYNISHDQHHKHSYYIISHCIMPGFTNDEAEVIANIARYHRKSHPKKKHESFNQLTSEKQYAVRVLGGILRIAEGIDRRQMQIVRDISSVYSNSRIDMILSSDPQKILPDIELWGANRRKTLLEEALNCKIQFHIDIISSDETE